MQKPVINGIEVKVGQKWKKRDGNIVIVKSITDGIYPIVGETESSFVGTWSGNGFYYDDGEEDDIDLVELVQDIEQPKAKARVVEETTNGVTNYMLEVLQENGDYVVIASSNNKETLIKEADTYSTIQCKVIHEVF